MRRIDPNQVRSPRFAAGAGLAACAFTALLLAPISAPAGAATMLLPDLVADPPGGSIAPQIYTDSSTGRTSLLLRFDGFVHNKGAGAVEIRGTGPSSDQMTSIHQRIYDSDGGYTDATAARTPTIIYEPADGHEHWHLRNAAGYSLWNESRTAQVGASNKVGFCLVDTQRVDAFGPETKAYTSVNTGFCQQRNRTAETVLMGVSPGWRDVYNRFLPYQWVDISDVAPGRYWLRSTIDPDDVVIESDESNPAAFGAGASTVNGYRAESFAQQVAPLLSSSITLRSTKFDDSWAVTPGAVEYRIDSIPQGGTLNRAKGAWFSGSLSYRPKFGFTGRDSFTFSARDASSGFPIHPVQATVSLGVGTSPGPVVPPTQPGAGTTAMRTEAAPDVTTAPSGGSLLGRPVVQHHGPWVLASAVAGRAGVLRMVLRDGATELGTCRARVPVGGVVTCRFDAASGAHQHGGPSGEVPSVGVTLADTAGRVIARTSSE